MQVDVSFQFAKVYDIERFDVVLGQKFSLITNAEGNTNWFANNDPVLSIVIAGSNADLEATALGDSMILIFADGLTLIKQVEIRVVAAISEPAVNLGLTADAAVVK